MNALSLRFRSVHPTVLISGTLGLFASVAQAGLSFDQGFETDTAGWFSYQSSITRVASGSGGIASAEGGFHALIEEPAPGNSSGAFTRFDGYRDSWTGPWMASIMVYLDTALPAGEGFDYSVAASGSDGAHQRDFIFHIASDTSSSGLFVGASNNSNGATREDLDTLSNNYQVTASGWYEFQHVFYDNGGVLAVDLNLLDAGGSVLFTETRSAAADLIPSEVGGNRYGWFTFVDVAGGLAIDKTQLTVVPEPSAILFGLTGLFLGGLMFVRRRH